MNCAHSKTINSLQDQVKKLSGLVVKSKDDLEDFKVSSRKTACLIQKQHAALIIQKNTEIKAHMEDVCAYHDVLYEMSVEVYSTRRKAYSRSLRTVLLVITKTLSAYQVVLVDNIDQGNTGIENFICGFLRIMVISVSPYRIVSFWRQSLQKIEQK